MSRLVSKIVKSLPTIGIYVLKHKRTNRHYVGQSWNVQQRLLQHQRARKGEDTYIHRAIKKYGWESFEVQVIPLPFDAEQKSLDEAEQLYISFYNSIAPCGYNLTYGGSNGRLTETTKAKMSRSRKLLYAQGKIDRTPHNKGVATSKEQKRKISETLKRKYASGELISPSLGRPVSLERAAKQSATLKAAYASGKVVSAVKGMTHTPEAKQKISNAIKQRILSGNNPLPTHKGERWKKDPLTGKRVWFKKEDVKCQGS